MIARMKSQVLACSDCRIYTSPLSTKSWNKILDAVSPVAEERWHGQCCTAYDADIDLQDAVLC